MRKALDGARVALLLTLLGAGACANSPDPQILAQETSGGWLNIDFVHTGAALQEAQRCVRQQSTAEAVACFAFVDANAYRMSGPNGAGTFEGPLCWDARWQRNKEGTESGGLNPSRPATCPAPAGAGSVSPVDDTTPAESVAGALEPLEVRIDFDVDRDSSGHLYISGTTNLPDETVLAFSITQSAADYVAQDRGSVQNGQFRSTPFSKQGARLPPGAYEVDVTVPIHNVQPERVQRRLGSGLGAMSGPLVQQVNPNLESLGKTASIRRTVEIE